MITLETFQSFLITYGLNIVGAILILIFGRIAANFLGNQAKRSLERNKKLDTTLVRFVSSLVRAGIIIFAIMAALSRLGVQNTSFIALLGAAGLAIGLALEGALSNFAAGALVLTFNPYKVGDYIEAGGHFGRVEEIQIFNTVVVTNDNKTVIVPNAQVTGAPIVNYSKRGTVRVDMVFGIGYEDDVLKAKKVFQEILDANATFDPTMPKTVALSELADSSVNFAVRGHVKPEYYWKVWFEMTEAVKLRLDAEGISIPFPQRDVHLYQNPN